MFKALLAILILPVVGMLLLVGVIVESARAQPPAVAPPSKAARSESTSRAAEADGGPYEPVTMDGSAPDGPATPAGAGAERWRVSIDPRQERRFAPPAPRPLNEITLRF